MRRRPVAVTRPLVTQQPRSDQLADSRRRAVVGDDELVLDEVHPDVLRRDDDVEAVLDEDEREQQDEEPLDGAAHAPVVAAHRLPGH